MDTKGQREIDKEWKNRIREKQFFGKVRKFYFPNDLKLSKRK